MSGHSPGQFPDSVQFQRKGRHHRGYIHRMYRQGLTCPHMINLLMNTMHADIVFYEYPYLVSTDTPKKTVRKVAKEVRTLSTLKMYPLRDTHLNS